MACPLLMNPGRVLRRWISLFFLGSSLCFGQDSLEQQDEQDRTSSKTLDAGAQGYSWKRCRRMLTCYRSTNCSQTTLLPLGRPSEVLSAVPGHLLFQLETLQPCWRAVGRSGSVSSVPPVASGSPRKRAAAAQWVLLGGGCSGHPHIYAQTYPSLPLELPFPSGWCRWSPNPPRCCGFISGFTSTIGKKETGERRAQAPRSGFSCCTHAGRAVGCHVVIMSGF